MQAMQQRAQKKTKETKQCAKSLQTDSTMASHQTHWPQLSTAPSESGANFVTAKRQIQKKNYAGKNHAARISVCFNISMREIERKKTGLWRNNNNKKWNRLVLLCKAKCKGKPNGRIADV